MTRSSRPSCRPSRSLAISKNSQFHAHARGVAAKRSETQTAFTGGVGEGLDAAMITIVAAIERDRSDATRLGQLGELHAHRLGSLDVAAVLRADVLVARAHRTQ